ERWRVRRLEEVIHVPAPQTGVDHVGAGGLQLGDLRRVLADERFRPQLFADLDVRLELAQRVDEHLPGVATPGVIVVDAGHGLHVGPRPHDVGRRPDAVGHGLGRSADDVLVASVLEQAGRAADVDHGELLQLFGHRGDGQAIGARGVADHGVYLVVEHQAPVVRHDLVDRPVLVHRLIADFDAADAALLVDLVEQHLAGVQRAGAELGGTAGHEIDHRDLQLRRLLPTARRRPAGRAGGPQEPRYAYQTHQPWQLRRSPPGPLP